MGFVLGHTYQELWSLRRGIKMRKQQQETVSPGCQATAAWQYAEACSEARGCMQIAASTLCGQGAEIPAVLCIMFHNISHHIFASAGSANSQLTSAPFACLLPCNFMSCTQHPKHAADIKYFYQCYHTSPPQDLSLYKKAVITSCLDCTM